MSNQDQINSESESVEYSVTDILQAHDILISILLGKMIGLTKEPGQMVNIIKEMVEMQEVSDNVKNYVKLLLSPVEAAILYDDEA